MSNGLVFKWFKKMNWSRPIHVDYEQIEDAEADEHGSQNAL